MELTPITYLAIFVGSLYDRTGTPVPAILGGLAAAHGTTNLFVVIVVAAAGGIAGESAYYLAGRGTGLLARRYSPPQLRTRLHARLPEPLRDAIRPEVIGHWLILVFGRFLPLVGRAAAPLAGAARVRVGRFAACTVVGEVLLMAAYTTLALVLSKQLGDGAGIDASDGAIAMSLWLGPKILVVLVYAAVAKVYLRRRSAAR